MFFNTLSRSLMVRFGLIAVIMITSAFINTRSTEAAFAARQESSKQNVSIQESANLSVPQSTANEYTCTILTIRVFEESILMHCYPGDVTTIDWFAYPTTDRAQANRILSTLLATQAMNRKIGVGYDLNDTNVPPRCGIDNCRKIIWLGTGEPLN